MPAHIRIRILLLLAGAVICASVFAVAEVQRASDTALFEEYSLVRELRSAGMNMAIKFGEAAAQGSDAAREVEAAERVVVEAIDRVRLRPDANEASERGLVAQQADAAIALTHLASQALANPVHVRPDPARIARLDSRRRVVYKRFITANDDLLAELAVERDVQRRSSARRPVILVLCLILLFGLAHLWIVERPARRERRGGRSQREFGEAIQVARSEDEAYNVLSRHVERVAGARHVTVLNCNNSADRLEPATPVEAGSAAAGALDGAAPDSCLAIRLARTHHVVPGNEPLLSCDICGNNGEQTTCVPSLVGGQVVGAVLVDHRRSLDPERQRLTEQSVAEAAPVIANLRNLAVAEIRAATDGLTGLPNQRAVHETVKRAAALAGRTASQLALVLFDLDHFKAINDTYGHGKGDEVLAAVGAVAADTLRASDFVGRLGGEEFAAVLPATDRTGGIEAAEKLRAAIATIAVPGVDRAITASFGVAVMPDDAGEPELLLREADRALYSAKNAGRNRVETVNTSTTSPDVKR